MNIDLQWPLSDEQSRRLLEFCLAGGVDSFTATFLCASEPERQRMEHLLQRLAPFNRGVHQLERTVVYSGQSHFTAVECWSLNPQTIALILNACGGSLTSCQIGSAPQDWTFYRNGELFLGFVSHERYAFLRVSDEEYELFRALGLLYVCREE